MSIINQTERGDIVELDYPGLLGTISAELVPGRTESHSLLLWFLKNYYRLDEIEATDAVCDGQDDKGIDGIYVDDNLESIDVFQCKIVQNPAKKLGDTQLKEFVGTLAQLRDSRNIEEIVSSTTNVELARLLESENVSKKIQEGYGVRGIFVTNIARDNNASLFLDGLDDVRLFDKSELEASYIHAGPTAPVGRPVTFDVFGFDCSEYQIGDARVLIAPLKAGELLTLDGISSNELFAWNVRGSLGRTKVNKDIGRSIDNVDEHKNFLLFHNGLTLLCEKVERDEDKIQISGYSVVNGCQSLTSLFDHRDKVTEELRLLARLIELPPGNEMAEKITHHSNNQNPINARDLQSNSTIQRRLQNEFVQVFGQEIVYRIKRGEADGPGVTIDNDEAGRLLLAFDLKEPWTCHQSYKILDELHGGIYARPEVTADRIYAVHLIEESVVSNVDGLEDKLFSTYRLTRYFLLYLIRLALEGDKIGRIFCEDPGKFLRDPDGAARIISAFSAVVRDLIIDLNAEIRDRKESNQVFDFKRELKSPNAVRELAKSIIPQYQKAVTRDRAMSFGGEWESSSP